MTAVLIANSAATLFMVGVIWFVQVVHYPLMARAAGPGFPTLAADHQRLTGYVVGPPMVVEALTTVALLLWPPDGVSVGQAALGLGLLAGVWASTALLQAPRHRELARGFDEGVHRALVVGNRVRTAAWTARGAVVIWMLATALG
jgi:hypothetical protein